MLRQESSLGSVRGVVGDDCKADIVRVQIEAEGETHSVARGESFSIATDDGSIKIHIDPHTVLLPEREVQGPFGELLEDPLCDSIMDLAPGDHVETILRGNIAAAGDTIAVYGELEHALMGGDGYREPAVEAIKAVRALVIAIGEDGESQIEAWHAARAEAETQARAANEQEALTQQASRSSKPEASSAAPQKKDPLAEGPLSLLVPRCYAVLAVLAFALALQEEPPTTAFEGYRLLLGNVYWLAAMSLLASAAFAWRARRWMPKFHTVGGSDGGAEIHWEVGAYLALHGIVAALAIALAIPLGDVGWYFLAALGLFFPITILRRDRGSAAKARALLRARRLPVDLPDKRFGRVEGSFSGFVDYERKHTVSTDYHKQTYVGVDKRLQQKDVGVHSVFWQEKTIVSGDCQLQVEEGKSIELRLRDADWASSQAIIAYPQRPDPKLAYLFRGGGAYQESLRIQHLRKRPIVKEQARSGDSILAAARVRYRDGNPVLESAGPSSLLVFTGPAGRSASAELRRQLLLHYAGLAIMLTAVIAPIAIALLT